MEKNASRSTLFGTTRYEVNSTWSAINFGPILQPGLLFGNCLLIGTQEYILPYYWYVFFYFWIVNTIQIPRERRAKAMKLTLVNFIIATVTITTMVKAGPLKEVFQISPASDPIQLSGADRLSCTPQGAACYSLAHAAPSKCCYPYSCSLRSPLYDTMVCK